MTTFTVTARRVIEQTTNFQVEAATQEEAEAKIAEVMNSDLYHAHLEWGDNWDRFAYFDPQYEIELESGYNYTFAGEMNEAKVMPDAWKMHDDAERFVPASILEHIRRATNSDLWIEQSPNQWHPTAGVTTVLFFAECGKDRHRHIRLILDHGKIVRIAFLPDQNYAGMTVDIPADWTEAQTFRAIRNDDFYLTNVVELLPAEVA